MYGAGGTADSTSYELPAAGWRLLGTTRRPKGFAFRGAKGAVITSVVVRDGSVLVRGAGTYSLDEPAQGKVAVPLRLGGAAAGTAWCAAAPAQQVGERRSTAKTDRPGRFVGEPGSPPPVACPTPP